MNLRQEQAALTKSQDENLPIKVLDEPEQVHNHKRVKSMALRQVQTEKWQRLAQKMPTATQNNAYHVDSVHLSVLNNMAPFLQNTIYEKKIEKTTCKFKVEEISSFQTHALGMKSFFDQEIQKVLSDGVAKVSEGSEKKNLHILQGGNHRRTTHGPAGLRPMSMNAFMAKNQKSANETNHNRGGSGGDILFDVDNETFKLKLEGKDGKIINPTRAAEKKCGNRSFGQWLSATDLQNMNRSDNNVVHIRKNILDAKKRRSIIKPMCGANYTNPFTKMRFTDIKINHEEDMVAQRKKEEEEESKNAGFRMTAWRSNIEEKNRLKKPSLVDIILKHEHIFKLKKFCHEQKKIKKESLAMEAENDKNEGEQGNLNMKSELQQVSEVLAHLPGQGSPKSTKGVSGKKISVSKVKIGTRSTMNQRPGSRLTIARRAEKG
jgi:hypothetical protein